MIEWMLPVFLLLFLFLVIYIPTTSANSVTTFSCIHLYSHCVIANKHPDNLNISHDDAPFLHSLHMHVKSVIHAYCYRLACGARVSYTDCTKKRNPILPLLPKLQSYKLQCGSCPRIQTSFLPSYAALDHLSSSTWLLASPCTILLLPTAESVIFQFILCLYTFCRVCLLMSACFLLGLLL